MIYLNNPLLLDICTLFISTLITKAETQVVAHTFAHLSRCFSRITLKCNLWIMAYMRFRTCFQFPSREAVPIHALSSSPRGPGSHAQTYLSPDCLSVSCQYWLHPFFPQVFLSIWISLIISEVNCFKNMLLAVCIFSFINCLFESIVLFLYWVVCLFSHIYYKYFFP